MLEGLEMWRKEGKFAEKLEPMKHITIIFLAVVFSNTVFADSKSSILSLSGKDIIIPPINRQILEGGIYYQRCLEKQKFTKNYLSKYEIYKMVDIR